MSIINAPVTTSKASAAAPLQSPQETLRERLDRHLRSNIPRHPQLASRYTGRFLLEGTPANFG